MKGIECADGSAYSHNWEPVSFRFETQLLDPEGRVCVRQPDIDDARVYFICRRCRQWSYDSFAFAGYRLFGSAEEDA